MIAHSAVSLSENYIFYQILAHCAIHFFLLFRSMVKDGIPHSLRPYVWLRLAGAMLKKNTSEVTYKQVKKVSDYNNILLNTQPYKL